jgi:curved DNA-binding protein CbpA
MHTCACGRTVDAAGSLCARCAALQTLELTFEASEKQIRDAYRTLVKVWHPDRFPGDKTLRETAETRVKALNAAYVFLTSKDGRADAPPRARSAARPSAQPAQAGPQPRTPARPRFRVPTAALLKLGLIAGCVLVSGVFLMAMDSFFASDPTTGSVYSALRAHVVANARETADSLWGQAGQHWHALASYKNDPAPVAATEFSDPSQSGAESPDSQSAPDSQDSQSLHRREPGASHATTTSLRPYITSGLTRDEVIAVLGAPTASTASTLAYGASELDFTNGKLSGWRIAASAPIRVKLWPDAPVDPTLAAFKLGSTKNEVLVVQGTPTLFSESTFGYGGSRVYFENNRVVGWKNDPATVPLRLAP